MSLTLSTKIKLYGIVGSWWAGFSADDVAYALDQVRGQDIDVHIHSPGGYVDDGVAIFNQLRQHDGDVRVIVDGIAASAASLIAMAGKEIVMPSGTMMMVHMPWGVSIGHSDVHRENADLLDKWGETLADAYMERVNIPRDELVEMLNAETWLTGGEALAAGFATSTDYDFDETEDDDVEIVGDESFEEMDLMAAAEHYRAVASKDDRLPQWRSKPKLQPVQIELIRSTHINPQIASRVAAQVFETISEREMSNETNVVVNNAQPAQNDEAIQLAREQERRRGQEIRTLASTHGIDEEQVNAWIDNGTNVETVREEVLNILASRNVEPATQVNVTRDKQENLALAMQDALEARVGMKERDMKSPYASFKILDFARERARAIHGSAGLVGSAEDILKRAFAADIGITHGTSDFSNVLADVAHKSLLIGWTQAGETWQAWVRQGNVSDFKTHNRVGLGFAEALKEVLEMGEYESSTVNDRGSTIQAVKYGRKFGLSWEAMINDDLAALDRIPRGMGMAANRTIGNKVYGLLTGNGNVYDGNPLFDDGNHGNDKTSTELDEPGLNTIRSSMRTQTTGDGEGDDQQVLNLVPRYLIVPAALETAALRHTRAQVIPGPNGESIDNSVNNGRYEVIVEARLDADNVKRYYGAANPDLIDTVEVAGLNGPPMPELFEQDGFSVDGKEWKARVVFGVAVHDWRGLIRATGA